MNLTHTTLSETTLSNPKAVEYQWVRTMYVEGYAEHEINHYIQTCFGGDDTFADCFVESRFLRKVSTCFFNIWAVPLLTVSFDRLHRFP